MKYNKINTEFYGYHKKSSLAPFSELQDYLYGKPLTLRARLETCYGVTLGKYIRVIDGDTLLFFPTKTGLTGDIWTECDWDIFICDQGKFDTIVCLHPNGDGLNPDYDAAYTRLYKSYDLVPHMFGSYIRKNETLPLYVYRQGRLYEGAYADVQKWIYLIEKEGV